MGALTQKEWNRYHAYTAKLKSDIQDAPKPSKVMRRRRVRGAGTPLPPRADVLLEIAQYPGLDECAKILRRLGFSPQDMVPTDINWGCVRLSDVHYIQGQIMGVVASLIQEAIKELGEGPESDATDATDNSKEHLQILLSDANNLNVFAQRLHESIRHTGTASSKIFNAKMSVSKAGDSPAANRLEGFLKQQNPQAPSTLPPVSGASARPLPSFDLTARRPAGVAISTPGGSRPSSRGYVDGSHQAHGPEKAKTALPPISGRK